MSISNLQAASGYVNKDAERAAAQAMSTLEPADTDLGSRGGSAREPDGSHPAERLALMEPDWFCTDTRCRWNQPLEPLEQRVMGAPAGWTWPHRHDGEQIVLRVEIA